MRSQTLLISLIPILSKITFATQTNGYQAPLRNCNYKDLVPNSYIIYFTPGHSLERHSEAVGKDMKPFVHHIYNMYTEKIVYVGRSVDGALLEAIRADKGVEFVECEDAPHLEKEL